MASQIPGYQVVKKIGDGGMSTVYLAIQFSLGREVALKILSAELRDDPEFAERFYREAKIVGTLSHPNIISIYDIGQFQQHYYMAMDYLPGGCCSDLINTQQVPVSKALNIIKEMASALAYVHKQGYLHCDIKPENILFRTDGAAVLTDFGIARELNLKQQDGLISGTPHYMSPEQAQGKALQPSSDIYSLGVLFYELLTGRPPYSGGDAVSVAIKHVSAPIPTLPSELKTLQPLINRMMHKRCSSRFQSAESVTEAVNYIGADFLKQEAIDLSLPLKLSLAVDRLKDFMLNFSGINRRLQFSAKHGLIYKIAAEDFNLPDVQQLEEIMRQTTMHDTGRSEQGKTAISADTLQLRNDIIALAIKAQQAKVIVPAWQVYSLMVIISLSIGIPLAGDSIFDFFTQFSRPAIRFVE